MIELLSKAIFADGVGQALTVLERLIFIFVLSKFLGTDVYGTYITILAYVTFLNFIDFGYGQQLVNSLTVIYSRDKFRLFLSAYNSYLQAISIWVSIVFSFIAIVGSSDVMIDLNLAMQPEKSMSLSFLVIASSAKFLISMPGGLVLAIFRIRGENYKSILLKDLIVFFSIVNIFFSVSIFESFRIYLLLEIAFSVFVYIMVMFWLRRYHQRPTIKSLKGALKGAKIEFFNAKAFFKIGIAQNLNSSGIILVLSRTADSSTIAIISTTRMIMSMVWPLVGVISHAIWPELTRTYAKNNLAKVFMLLKINSLGALTAITVISIVLNVFANEIAIFWSPYNYLVDKELLFILFVTYSPLIVCNTYSNFLMAVSKHNNWSNTLLLTTMSTLATMFLIADHFSTNITLFISFAVYSILLIILQTKDILNIFKSNMPKVIILDAIMSIVAVITAFGKIEYGISAVSIVLGYLVFRIVITVIDYA